MSFYNMLYGVRSEGFLLFPMLGKHHDEFPRFRDCFISDPAHPEYDDYIHIYTRTGGLNREDYADENNKIREMPGFVIDFDDDDDNTYASWIFEVPNQWKVDFNKIKEGKLKEISKEYKEQLLAIYQNFMDGK